MVLEAVSMVLSAQQEHASDPVFFRHSPALVLNVSTALLHFVTSVTFGWGRLEGSQLFLISSSHLSSVSVRLVSCLAPLLDCPLHVRLEALPPPFSTILRTIGPKIPFFPDLPPKQFNYQIKLINIKLLLPVLFCLLIRAFCFSKFATLSFSNLKYPTAVSMQLMSRQVDSLTSGLSFLSLTFFDDFLPDFALDFFPDFLSLFFPVFLPDFLPAFLPEFFLDFLPLFFPDFLFFLVSLSFLPASLTSLVSTCSISLMFCSFSSSAPKQDFYAILSKVIL